MLMAFLEFVKWFLIYVIFMMIACPIHYHVTKHIREAKRRAEEDRDEWQEDLADLDK